MKVQDVLDPQVAFDQYALTATESIDELVKVIEGYQAVVESLSRELAETNILLEATSRALNRMDEYDRKRNR